ncbi:RNA polymerase sigma factor [Posidoniimonas corsicana]|uniref:RNA polymerase sigma factor n=1 Tax=Posidoniimonas corsicana TaxID=1938618 RepID=A0A5C5V9N9_9BACT|nr:sigma-70 family RNA polymerase sigma factor [Posidoniimonas corsicana]TWT35304.1 RNA polymerase sigma factor [Posidoniimonas corsicana]
MESWDDRLSRIPTLWSMVRRAHGDGQTEVGEAQRELLERYGGAVRRYALAALRNEEAADDVFQEFALRFVRGDFQKANPEKGRFRSFLKTTVYHLIVDYQRKKKRGAREAQMGDDAPEPVAADEESMGELFNESWRDDLLSRTWESLETLEQTTGKPYHTALRLRVEHPEARSPELAELLSDRLGKPMKAGAARVLLHRSREAFADLLLEEVAHSLDDASMQRLEEELIDLNLLEYCRPAFEKKASAEAEEPS